MNRGLLLRSWLICSLVLFLISCQKETKLLVSPVPYINSENSEWADSLLLELSLDQKIGQLLLWEPNEIDSAEFLQAVQKFQIGGFQINQARLAQYLYLVDTLSKQSSIPLFYRSDVEVLLNDHFSDIPYGPYLASVNATRNDSLWKHLNPLLIKQAKELKINWLMGAPSGGNYPGGDQLFQGRTKLLANEQIIGYGAQFQDFHPSLNDTSQRLLTLTRPANKLVSQEIGAFELHPTLPDSAGYEDYFNQLFNYDGIITKQVELPEQVIPALMSGISIVSFSFSPQEMVEEIQIAVQNKRISLKTIDRLVHRTLMAKKWMYNGFDAFPSEPKLQAALPVARPVTEIENTQSKIYHHFIDEDWDYFNWCIEQEAITLLNDPNEILPIRDLSKPLRIIQFADQGTYRSFRDQVKNYQDYTLIKLRRDRSDKWSQRIRNGGTALNLFLVRDSFPSREEYPKLWEALEKLNEAKRLLFVYLGPSSNLREIPKTFPLAHAYQANDQTESLMAQMLFGGQLFQGKLPYAILPQWQSGTGIQTAKIRLGYGPTQQVGLRPEKLVGIHAIINGAIRRKATPGAQVWVAKKGQVIFSGAYGYHTYRRRNRVQEDHLFDLASVTKIAATTLLSMDAYEKGHFRINDPLVKHLPSYEEAPFKNAKIKDVLTHRTGIQPHVPVIPYLLYRDSSNTACDSFFCAQSTEIYPTQVAKNFYFKKPYQDSIWERLNTVQVSTRRRFRYSDVNFLLMQRLVESKNKENLAALAQQKFYQPLGLRKTQFKPLETFDLKEILPTELDKKWRHQQVHGYVHDETAALLGGIAGHAGLFSNAADLGILFTMLANRGSYGGKRFLKPQTVDLFTRSGHGNHRGLGFDKPHRSNRTGRAYDISGSAFGHTGFTGTCVWVDPDEELVFIFLSNRVFPDARNRKLFTTRIRTRVHQVVYDALDSYETHWPDLIY